jgi:hypothetical protein
MISQAASRRNVTIVLPQAFLTRAMTHLHRELFALAERVHEPRERSGAGVPSDLK